MLRGLHKLCDKAQWAEAKVALQSKKLDPTEKAGWGDWTALHCACRRDPPFDIVQALIEAAPETTGISDSSGKLPLHHAAERGDKISVLNALISSNAKSAATGDTEGKTPLHLSIIAGGRESRQQRAPLSVQEVQVLLGQTIEDDYNAAKKADVQGNLPLHTACNNIDNVNSEIIAAIVNANKEALYSQNEDGNTPLHLALLKSTDAPTTLQTVSILLGSEHAERICSTPDKFGQLVLHCACKNFATFEVLQQLLLTNPQAAYVQCTSILPGVGISGRAPTRGPRTPVKSVQSPSLSGRHEKRSYPIDFLEQVREFATTPVERDELDFKSDLIFAANPNVEPYKYQEERLHRLEELIIYEASEDGDLSPPAASVWRFLATNEEDPEGLYSSTVKRIIGAVSYAAVRMLAGIDVPSEDSKQTFTVRDKASAKCAAMLNPYFRFVDRFEFDGAAGTTDERVRNLVMHRTDETILVKAWDCSFSAPSANKRSRRPVLIKFHKNYQRFLREVDAHCCLLDYADGGRIIPLLAAFDTTRIGTPDELAADSDFKRDMEEFNHQLPFDVDAFPCKCATVMPMGDRDLADIVRHELETKAAAERDDAIRRYCHEMGLALVALHSKGLVHRQLEISSFVRIDGKLHLAGLDSVEELPGSTRLHGSVDATPPAPLFTGRLPPEMFAEISNEEVMAYCSYWNTMMSDAQVESSFEAVTQEETEVVLAGVQAFLGDEEQDKFDALRKRFQKNKELWDKIRPRRIASVDGKDRFVVLKCFKNDKEGNPLFPDKLPYCLQPVSDCFDIWAFATLVFELNTGRPPFLCKRNGDLSIDSEFVQLGTWAKESAWKLIEDQSIGDPLLRDLLRRLFAASGNRPLAIEEVIDHVYFKASAEQNQVFTHLISAVVKSEQVKVNEALRTQNLARKKKEQLASVTTELSAVAVKAKLLFHFSSATQWKSLCQNFSGTIPTSFVLLPYQLQGTNSASFAPEEHDGYGNFMATQLGDVLFYCCLTANFREGNTQGSNFPQLDRPTSNQQAGSVAACERVVSSVDWAEEALEHVLTTVVNEPGPFARKIVRDIVENMVDLRFCHDMLEKAAEAEKAFMLMMSDIDVPEAANKEAAKRFVNEKLGGFIDETLGDDLWKESLRIEEALSELVQNFTTRPLEICSSNLLTAVKSLMEGYQSSGSLFFYLMDEFTGMPMLDSEAAVDASPGSDHWHMLLPSMYVCLQAMCAKDFATTATVFGLKSSTMESRQWFRTSQCKLGLPEATDASLGERLESFREALASATDADNNIGMKGSDYLDVLVDFVEGYGGTWNVPGLRRLVDPNGACSAWTLSPAEAELRRASRREMVELMGKTYKEITARRELDLMNRGVILESEMVHASKNSPHAACDAIKIEVPMTPTPKLLLSPSSTRDEAKHSFSDPLPDAVDSVPAVDSVTAENSVPAIVEEKKEETSENSTTVPGAAALQPIPQEENRAVVAASDIEVLTPEGGNKTPLTSKATIPATPSTATLSSTSDQGKENSKQAFNIKAGLVSARSTFFSTPQGSAAPSPQPPNAKDAAPGSGDPAKVKKGRLSFKIFSES